MNDRIERLKSDAAELNVSKGAARDGLWQTAGAIAMAVGVVLAFVAYQLSLGKDDPRDIVTLYERLQRGDVDVVSGWRKRR